MDSSPCCRNHGKSLKTALGVSDSAEYWGEAAQEYSSLPGLAGNYWGGRFRGAERNVSQRDEELGGWEMSRSVCLSPSSRLAHTHDSPMHASWPAGTKVVHLHALLRFLQNLMSVLVSLLTAHPCLSSHHCGFSCCVHEASLTVRSRLPPRATLRLVSVAAGFSGLRVLLIDDSFLS